MDRPFEGIHRVCHDVYYSGVGAPIQTARYISRARHILTMHLRRKDNHALANDVDRSITFVHDMLLRAMKSPPGMVIIVRTSSITHVAPA